MSDRVDRDLPDVIFARRTVRHSSPIPLGCFPPIYPVWGSDPLARFLSWLIPFLSEGPIARARVRVRAGVCGRARSYMCVRTRVRDVMR